MNKYYIFNDGFFTYYINCITGEKKFELDIWDKIIEPKLDDFSRD